MWNAANNAANTWSGQFKSDASSNVLFTDGQHFETVTTICRLFVETDVKQGEEKTQEIYVHFSLLYKLLIFR